MIQVHTCRGVLECQNCSYRARPAHKPAHGTAQVCKICTPPQLLVHIDCGVKTTTTFNASTVQIIVDRDHDHETPPAAKLLKSSKALILQMVKDGKQVTGAISNFAQLLPNDPAALQEERVNAEVRKAHKELFGDDLDFGGIPSLTQNIIMEDFVREAVKDVFCNSKTICFLQTNFQQKMIETCDYIFGDISYKLCRKYYKMVITGYSHVTHKGVVVATAFLERADEVSYATFFGTLFKHNPKLVAISPHDIVFSFEALALDFSDAQRKGFISALILLARAAGCKLSDEEIKTKALLSLKGCGFHFQQSLRKVATSGALRDNAFRSVFTSHVNAWLNSDNMKQFNDRKTHLKVHFPSVRGWIHWWALPVHAVMIFPSVRQELLGETDEMYGRLPSSNNNSEGTNSMESHLCKHNVELVPAIMDSWRITNRQQKLHEGVLTGESKLKCVNSVP
jgi:hypothetical protein